MKSLALAFLLCISGAAQAREIVLFSEDFSDGIEGWAFVDATTPPPALSWDPMGGTDNDGALRLAPVQGGEFGTVAAACINVPAFFDSVEVRTRFSPENNRCGSNPFLFEQENCQGDVALQGGTGFPEPRIPGVDVDRINSVSFLPGLANNSEDCAFDDYVVVGILADPEPVPLGSAGLWFLLTFLLGAIGVAYLPTRRRRGLD